MKHDFHLVLSDDLNSKIDNLSKRLKLTKSETANFIIGKTLNFFKKYSYEDEDIDVFTSYQKINWHKNFHIYMLKDIYRKIKHLCAINNVFSIAILIRWLFNYYFNNLIDDKTQRENINEIKRIEEVINTFEKKIKCWQKSIESKQLSGNLYYQLTFNDKFTLIGFNFLC